jgi:type VI protein secretion system component VasK
MSAGQHAHDLEKMKDALQRAESDLDRAQELYSQIAPFYQGYENAEKVSLERGEAAKYLAEAQAVNDPPKQTP